MTDFIPDPDAPHLRAIDPATGCLAAGVFLIDAATLADPKAPTAAELEAMATPENHIGYVKPSRFRLDPQEGRP